MRRVASEYYKPFAAPTPIPPNATNIKRADAMILAVFRHATCASCAGERANTPNTHQYPQIPQGNATNTPCNQAPQCMQDTWVEDPGAFRKQPVGGGRGAKPVRSSVARRQAVAAGSAANGFSKNRHPPQDARAAFFICVGFFEGANNWVRFPGRRPLRGVGGRGAPPVQSSIARRVCVWGIRPGYDSKRPTQCIATGQCSGATRNTGNKIAS